MDFDDVYECYSYNGIETPVKDEEVVIEQSAQGHFWS